MLLRVALLIFAFISEGHGVTDPASSVCIIGAGLTGLTTAYTLRQTYNFPNIIIFEADDEVGGRVFPVQMPNGDGQTEINLGAEFVASGTPLATLAGNLVTPSASVQSQYNTGKGCNLPTPVRQALETMFDFVQRASANPVPPPAAGTSLGSIANLQYKLDQAIPVAHPQMQVFYSAAFNQSFKKAYEFQSSALSWFDISPKQISQFTDASPYTGGVRLSKNGWTDLLNTFVNGIGLNNIRVNCSVTQISYQNDNITISTSCGQPTPCQFVVDTRSVCVLKKVYNSYNPPLPQNVINTILNYGCGLTDKFAMIYPQPFWNPQQFSQAFFLRGGSDDNWSCSFNSEINNTLSNALWALYPLPSIPNVLVGSVASDLNPALFEMASDSDIISNFTAVLRQFFNRNNIPPPSQILRSAFGSDPNQQGSSAYISMKCDALGDTGCSRSILKTPIQVTFGGTPRDAIYIAGEATSPTGFGTANGAYTEGLDTAKKISGT